MRNNQDNKMDSSWRLKFYNEPGSEPPYWEFYPNNKKAFLPHILFNSPHIFPSDENGWISADADPPEKGNYLAWEGKFWDRIYWDGQMWKSKWPPKCWRPIVPPEDTGERFIILERGESEAGYFLGIIDTESGNTIAKCAERDLANHIVEHLNNRDKC